MSNNSSDGHTEIRADSVPPPPGGALLAALTDLKPVRTRVPVRDLLIVLAVASVLPVASVVKGLRPDLGALPVSWTAVMALVWAVAAGLALSAALLPRRGEVLPDVARAGRTAVVNGLVLVLVGLFGTVDAAGFHREGPTFTAGLKHCLTFSLEVTAITLAIGAVLLRGTLPIGAARVAAALGAAGGALGGLTLHFICSFGGGLHVGFGHGGGVIAGAALAAVALPLILRAPR